MNNEIYPCLWFDGNGKEAADLYCSVFNNSKITADTPMVVQFEIEGKRIMALNGGPMFKKNPSISLFFTSTQSVFFDEQLHNFFYSFFSVGTSTVLSTLTFGATSG